MDKERALSKKKSREDFKKVRQILAVVPYLPIDCINKILLLLPLESLQTCRFVCKTWYNLINGPAFINDHCNSSESVLICLRSRSSLSGPISPQLPNTFSVEYATTSKSSRFDLPGIYDRGTFEIQFMKFKDDKLEIGGYNISCRGSIKAACNGLILLHNRIKGDLIVMNPVTRKVIKLPLGTLCDLDNESYAFAQCDETRDYKVVHLFGEKDGNASCEILGLKNLSWRPAYHTPSIQTFWFSGHQPVLAIGAFHWLPQADEIVVHMLSMGISNEDFHIMPLPKMRGKYDLLLEMKNCLCFVTHEDNSSVSHGDSSIQIWGLDSLQSGNWTKQHVITRSCNGIVDLNLMVPLISFRQSGVMIFIWCKDWSLFAYDFNTGLMTKIMNQWLPSSGCYIPHVDTLKTWD